MFKTLNVWAIGVQWGNLDHALELAKLGGFGGLEFDVGEVATLIEQHGLDHVKQKFAAAGVQPGGWGLPVDWRGEEAKFRADLEKLSRYAKAAGAIGPHGGRCFTWVLSGS